MKRTFTWKYSNFGVAFRWDFYGIIHHAFVVRFGRKWCFREYVDGSVTDCHGMSQNFFSQSTETNHNLKHKSSNYADVQLID